MARQVLENGVVLPAEYSDDWYDDMTSNLTKLDDVIGSDSEKLSSADVGAAALSNNYNDLDNLPTIPTVNDATLTIQKNGVDVQTFTANASSNVTANITVPTKTSDLTNDSNFVDTSNSAVSSGITSAKVTDYDSHVADTDIHVTTADKTKWNNGVSQSYVLRYSSSSVTDNSTIAFSTLDNTDNIKSGDKVIDADGKIFSVVSVDTANQTVTVGSALVDLALDANVVHTSGNETVGGVKTFSDDTYIKSLNFTNEVASTSSSSSSIMPIITTVTYTDQTASKSARINLRITADGTKSLYPHENNQYALGLTTRKWSEVHGVTYYYGSSDTEFSDKFVTTDTDQTISGVKTFNGFVPINGAYLGNEPSTTFRTVLSLRSRYDTAGKSGWLVSKFRSNSAQGALSGSDTVFLNFDVLENEVRTNGILRFNLSSWSGNTPTRFSLIPNSAIESYLGTSGNKWAAINGLNPSSLSLPDLSNGIDISSYITVGNSHNEYIPTVNGWISVILKSTSGAIGVFLYQGGMASSCYSSTSLPNESEPCVMSNLPVKAGTVVNIDTKGSNSYVYSAKFYPCQGNV